MKTKPLPPVREDPAVLAGWKITQSFPQRCGAILSDQMLSELARAEKLDALWRSDNDELARLFRDLQARRRARLEDLEASVPVGPGIDPSTSPADKAVLMSSWRTSLDRARDSEGDGLVRLTRDALKFGDDIAARACLTVAVERGDPTVLGMFKDTDSDLVDQLREINDLRLALAGQGFDNQWLVLSLRQLKQPDLASQLPVLRQVAAAAKNANLRQYGATTPPYAG